MLREHPLHTFDTLAPSRAAAQGAEAAATSAAQRDQTNSTRTRWLRERQREETTGQSSRLAGTGSHAFNGGAMGEFDLDCTFATRPLPVPGSDRWPWA